MNGARLHAIRARAARGARSVTLHRPLAPEGRAAARDRRAVPCAVRSRPWVLAATILASAMAFIDGSVVTIALPVLQRELGAGLGALQWVVNGYTLFLGALILVGGAAGDRFGRRRVFLAGTGLFALASLGCALAPGVGWLVAARMAQGIGAAAMVPQSLAIISAAFPPEIRGRAIGTWAGASAITTALGPAVGGFLIDSAGWRAAFWINLPLSLAVVALAATHVPESRSPAAGTLDWAGGALAVAASALAHARADGARRAGAPACWAVGLIVAGGLAAVAFVRAERAAAAPLVPLTLFASRAFTGANLLTLFLYGALSAVMFLLPFELIGARGLSASTVGLVLLPVGLIIGVGARPAGALADRLGVRGFLVAGSALVAVAAAWLALGRGGHGRRGAAADDARRRHGAGGGAADDRGDERGAGRAGRRRLGREQRRQPAGRALRRRAGGRGRGAGVRGGGGGAGRALRGLPAAGRPGGGGGGGSVRPGLARGDGRGGGAGGAGRRGRLGDARAAGPGVRFFARLLLTATAAFPSM